MKGPLHPQFRALSEVRGLGHSEPNKAAALQSFGGKGSGRRE